MLPRVVKKAFDEKVFTHTHASNATKTFKNSNANSRPNPRPLSLISTPMTMALLLSPKITAHFTTIHDCHHQMPAYWQYCFTGRKAFEEKRWMVAFEGIQDGAPKVVHHIVLHGFDKPGCVADAHEVSVW